MKPTNPRAKRRGRAGNQAAESAPRQGTKIATVIELLRSPNGASIEDLTVATEWQPHTTRAAITGLRKRGLVVERTKEERRKRIATIYRIIGT